MKNVLFSIIVMLAVMQPALAEREDIIPILNTLLDNKSDKITISINDGSTSKLSIGDALNINIESKVDAYISVIHMDDNGVTTLLTPKFNDGTNKIKAGSRVSYPAGSDDLVFEVSAPIGIDSIYVIATEKPLMISNNPADTAPGSAVEFGIDTAKIENLKASILNASSNVLSANTKMLSYRVTGRSGPTQYVQNDIVAYFTASTTRSLKKPRMPAEIKFEFDSDKLTADATANLDEWGKSLNHPQMKKMKFIIAGHTDNMGDDNYNMMLSDKRATAVKQYLVDKYSIDLKRLKTEAHGENNPMMEGASD